MKKRGAVRAQKAFHYPLHTFNLQDIVETTFGIMIGLFFFLTGGGEMFTMGALMSDGVAIGLVLINLFLLYSICRIVSGKVKSGFLLLESVRYPLIRSLIVFTMAYAISFITIFWLNNIGLFDILVRSAAPSLIPVSHKVSIFTAFFSSLLAITFDLSVVD